MRVIIYTCARCGGQAVGSALRIPKRWKNATLCSCALPAFAHKSDSPALVRARLKRRRR